MTEWLDGVYWPMWWEWAFTLDGWISLLTLTFLEIVLGIDNLVFLSIASQRLPPHQRAGAQRTGLLGALILRIAMLALLVWLTRLNTEAFTLFGIPFTWSGLIFIAGGAFLLYKGTMEIHEEMEGSHRAKEGTSKEANFVAVIFLIMVIDFVFALDSIITAVGLSQFLPVMILANVIAILVMLLAAGPISGFIDRHPTVKMLALAFIMLIGVALVADGLNIHIPRGFIYFAIAFSLAVEALNIMVKARRAGLDADRSSDQTDRDDAS
ncbi:TerC family protein [soil metagenome]